MLQLDPPSLIGRHSGHFWFPIIHPLMHGCQICLVAKVPDVDSGLWRSRLLFSRDSKDWQDLGEVPTSLASCMRDDGLLVLPYEFWPGTNRRCASGRGIYLKMTKGKMPTWDEQQITVAGFPHNIAPHLEGKTFLADGGDAVLPLADGALLHTYYGRLEGDRKYRLFAVVSDDGGLSWHYRATIADGQTMRAVREGPSEAATVRLDDGSLLCIYRVDSGAGIPFGRSISMDEGRTWKRLRPMYGKGSVKPQLARLADGTILLSGGRPGIYLWVCTDGMGRRWRRHDLVAHHNHSASKEDQYLTLTPGGGEAPALSTCYTSMQPIGPDAVLIAYERLGNGWGGSPGLHGATDAVFCLRARMPD